MLLFFHDFIDNNCFFYFLLKLTKKSFKKNFEYRYYRVSDSSISSHSFQTKYIMLKKSLNSRIHIRYNYIIRPILILWSSMLKIDLGTLSDALITRWILILVHLKLFSNSISPFLFMHPLQKDYIIFRFLLII